MFERHQGGDRAVLVQLDFGKGSPAADLVELAARARLWHLSPGVCRGGSPLARQRGGIGQRGPRETQLETDRQLRRARIKARKERIAKVSVPRSTQRRARQKSTARNVALVGYT